MKATANKPFKHLLTDEMREQALEHYNVLVGYLNDNPLHEMIAAFDIRRFADKYGLQVSNQWNPPPLYIEDIPYYVYNNVQEGAVNRSLFEIAKDNTCKPGTLLAEFDNPELKDLGLDLNETPENEDSTISINLDDYSTDLETISEDIYDPTESEDVDDPSDSDHQTDDLTPNLMDLMELEFGYAPGSPAFVMNNDSDTESFEYHIQMPMLGGHKRRN